MTVESAVLAIIAGFITVLLAWVVFKTWDDEHEDAMRRQRQMGNTIANQSAAIKAQQSHIRSLEAQRDAAYEWYARKQLGGKVTDIRKNTGS